jgi:hypothetical protein
MWSIDHKITPCFSVQFVISLFSYQSHDTVTHAALGNLFVFWGTLQRQRMSLCKESIPVRLVKYITVDMGNEPIIL